MSGPENIRQVHSKRKFYTMKNNVIIPELHQIEIESEGILSILGTAHGKVIFMATGIMWRGEEKLERISKKRIIFNNLDAEGLAIGDAIIFEYPIEGRIRNPRKLLKSVRNRLMKVILDAAQEEWFLHPGNHPSAMFQNVPVDRSEPLPKVCFY
jgi:hypothetical protein